VRNLATETSTGSRRKLGIEREWGGTSIARRCDDKPLVAFDSRHPLGYAHRWDFNLGKFRHAIRSGSPAQMAIGAVGSAGTGNSTIHLVKRLAIGANGDDEIITGRQLERDRADVFGADRLLGLRPAGFLVERMKDERRAWGSGREPHSCKLFRSLAFCDFSKWQRSCRSVEGNQECPQRHEGEKCQRQRCGCHRISPTPRQHRSTRVTGRA